MGLETWKADIGSNEVESRHIFHSSEPTVQSYEFDCPNCSNHMDKTTTGEYYPKSHLCHECMSWLWVWPNGDSSWDDELVVSVI